jgi:K+-transporting ATPase KdpF subunit
MTIGEIISELIAVVLLVYLPIALLGPERF